ncbi:killer toxin subunits alpha beta [Fusarium beomiforme]|uniref:Killer toxin subunits alpha beta n=1 Tax=Fusarium beomiforme TaxID=44412 RepID=A0A9P5AJP1_9HYPO|nr:killer toxin subunits alpha beta [Fusarium beomiforme]
MRPLSSLFAPVACYLIFTCSISAAPTEKEVIDNFEAALADSHYNFTDRDVVGAATRLFGWQGCSTAQSQAIYSGWQQSWKIMDAVQGENLNWNEAAALDYLAPPFINEEQQAEIKKIIDTVVTIRGGSSFNPFKWWLHVRCDDPAGKCPCGGNSPTFAYTTNKDRDSGYARINFCPRYFRTPNLDQVVSDNSKRDLPIEHRADLRNYVRNKGRVWFHELLHIDWASGVLPGWHIKDLEAYFLDEDKTLIRRRVYDPEMTKGLARYKFDPPFFIRRNADSFAMYSMAKYVQKAIGKYPHLPIATTLNDVDDMVTLLMIGDMTIDLQGQVTIAGPQDQDLCQIPDDEDGSEKNQDVVPFNSSAWFWATSAYPEDYQRQLRGWLADATPHHNRVRIVLMQTAMGPQWMAFQDTPDEPIKDFCTAKILARAPAEGDKDNLKFPTELPAFDAHAAKGCVYSGTSDLVGGLTCKDGAADIRCWEDPEWGEMSQCDGGRYMLGIKCDWK